MPLLSILGWIVDSPLRRCAQNVYLNCGIYRTPSPNFLSSHPFLHPTYSPHLPLRQKTTLEFRRNSVSRKSVAVGRRSSTCLRVYACIGEVRCQFFSLRESADFRRFTCTSSIDLSHRFRNYTSLIEVHVFRNLSSLSGPSRVRKYFRSFSSISQG